MIPSRLLDPTLKTKNPNGLYIVCILLRIILGLFIHFSIIPTKILYMLYALVIVFFSYKLYITQNKTWKVYNKTIIIYVINLLLTFTGNNSTAGILIIFDALLGSTSKHIQGNFKD